MAFLTSPFWLQTLDAINRNPCQRHLHLKRLFFSIWIWAEAHFLESSSFIYCSAHDLIWNMQICSDTFLHSETNQWPKHWVKRWAKLWSVTCSRWISRNQWNIICTQKINRNLCSKFTNSWMQQLLLTRKHSVFPHASQTWNCAGPTAGAPALQRPQERGHWFCRQNLRLPLKQPSAVMARARWQAGATGLELELKQVEFELCRQTNSAAWEWLLCSYFTDGVSDCQTVSVTVAPSESDSVGESRLRRQSPSHWQSSSHWTLWAIWAWSSDDHDEIKSWISLICAE